LAAARWNRRSRWTWIQQKSRAMNGRVIAEHNTDVAFWLGMSVVMDRQEIASR
jgi:hypothetical protein